MKAIFIIAAGLSLSACATATSRGFDTFTSETPIVPVRMPDERTAFEFTRRCRERGVFVVPVVFPAVPQNAPRLRTCVTAGLTTADLDMPWK